MQPRIRIALGVIELDPVHAGADGRHLFMDLTEYLLEAVGQPLAFGTSSRLAAPETHDISALLES